MTAVADIDLPYIEKNPTRHGKVRYYFRFEGKRICRLPDDIRSEEFSAEYWKARRQIEKPDPAAGDGWTMASPTRPNSFRWLCMRYMRSNAFTTLDLTTQTKRRQIMEAMWAEPLKASEPDGRAFADMPIAKLDVANIEALRDRKKDTPFAANERLKILRQVFETQENGKAITPNVAKLAAPFRVQSTGHHTITSAEIAQFIEHHGPRSKAVFALVMLMFTGFRVSDLAQIGPQHRRRDELHLRLFKNRGRAPTDIVIPVHPVLETVLSWHPVAGLTYMRTEYDKPYSIKGLGQRVSEWFDQAGLPHCSAHSVRKGLATNQAENEATDKMLDAMFGWKDAKTSRIYTARADRSRLARQAVQRISWDGIGDRLLAAES
ncbi:tyrosine-type recombinase/integrase [Aureimonas leprariae]|uniref:Tyrosine-type recombinase/integrase n=1 Tax=Plantimonas leprariae TaxID=2615207 RepID=A0A7V7TXY6_9HYPH|nr:tyrosine-type recombinase/integrase [Aureimonas leprariae]KAB0682031.1 tyrosine-type recombinase/integrase [Aureimonas leprariae]